MDEHNTRMQATVRMALVNQFKDKLGEGKAVTIQRYTIGEIKPNYRMVNNAFRLSFLMNTDVEICNDFTGSLHGFDFRSYSSITQLKQEENCQFDVIGHVVACEDLDNYDKNGKAGKKKPLTLVDAESWKNCYGSSTCYDEDVGWLFANQDIEKSNNTSTRISTSSQNSTKESFVSMFPSRNITELLDVAQGVPSIIVGTIIAIHEEEGWWYIGCKGCKKKVIRASDMVDLEADMPKKPCGGKDDWWCTKCNIVPNIKTMFRLQIRVQDESGTVSLTIWNDEVQAVMEHKDMFPIEITALVGKKYAFKVSIDEYNKKKMLPVFTVLRLSGDPDIIESIRPTAAPTK
ncbi:replication protein A 70 kDa DNA-binding subunit B, partial [Tanacetum coccineum]